MTSAPVVRFLDRRTPPHIVTLVLLAGVSALNMSVFLPSLARMAEHFGTSYAVMQISVSGYLAVTGALQLLIGPLSDRWGRRPVMLGALVIFILSTIGALFAPTVGWFLVFRMLQGAIVTGIVLSRAIVRDMVPQDQAASMIGYVTMGMALVPMVGPMIGGALEQVYGWQATFVFLAACGIAVLALALADQGETAPADTGAATRFEDLPELLTSPRFWGYALAAAFASGAFFAYLGGAAFVAQEVYGFTPFWTGVALGAPAIGYAAGNYLTGRWARHTGINRLILLGTLVAAAGMGLSLAINVAGLKSGVIFFTLCTFLGLGNGLTMPNTMAGLLSVRPRLAGTASGVGGAIMIGGGAALSALAGALLTVESGSFPLQAIMFATSSLSCVAILFVIRRARKIGA